MRPKSGESVSDGRQSGATGGRFGVRAVRSRPDYFGVLPLTYGPWNGDDFFDRWHDDGDEAFQILQEGFDVAPPSCEVFEHGLEDQRRREPRRPLSVVEYAHRLVQNHQPINGL